MMMMLVLRACGVPALALILSGTVADSGSERPSPPCVSVQRLESLPSGSRLAMPAHCFIEGATVRIAQHSVPLPRPGYGVGSHDVAEAGDAGSDLIVNNVAGEIQVFFDVDPVGSPADAGATALAAAASPSACSDATLSWQGLRNNGWGYYINTRVVPSGISTSTFQSEINLAEGVLETGGNDCGLPTGSSLFDIDISKLGATTVPAAGTDGSCQKDSTDVIDFGYLPAGTLGRTCEWHTILPFADDVVYAADVRLNRSSKWFSTIPPACSNAYEIEGVLVHEFGHVFGLGHVDEATHGNLTMSTNATPCSYADHTWGKGDYNSLAAHY